jgi:hypothetical protein
MVQQDYFNELMAETHVGFQITRSSKTLLAHIAFVRLLVRVNTHVDFQFTRFTKSFIAHITFVRFLLRVNTHVSGQLGWSIKHLLANIALVLLRSLSLHSFSRRRYFSYLIFLDIKIDLIFVLRNPQKQPNLVLLSLPSKPFSALFGCGFFLRPPIIIITVSIFEKEESVINRRVVVDDGEPNEGMYSYEERKIFFWFQLSLDKKFCSANFG